MRLPLIVTFAMGCASGDALPVDGIDVVNETWRAVHPDCIFEGRIYGMPVNAAANAIMAISDFTSHLW